MAGRRDETEVATQWSAADLRAYLGDRKVFARDRTGRRVPVPAVLATRTESSEARWSDQVAHVHPRDRVTAARLWFEAGRSPGQPVSAEVHSQAPGTGSWHATRLTYLDLSHQPDVGVVLIFLEDGGIVPEPPPLPEAGDPGFEAPTWTLAELSSVGTVLRCDGMVTAMFQRRAAELEGRSILEFVHPDDYDQVLGMWLDLVDDRRGTRTLRHRLVRADGSTVWVESTVINRLEGPTAGSVLAISHDVSDRRAQEEALVQRAETDPLTGLLNRQALQQRLATLLDPAGDGAVVAFLDLDGFKAVNDDAGHEAGDRVLAELARRLRRRVGADLAAARWGGDEFVVVGPAAGRDAVDSLRRAVEDVLREPVVLREGSWQPSASVGCVVADPGDDPAEVLRRADDQMYDDKRRGR